MLPLGVLISLAFRRKRQPVSSSSWQFDASNLPAGLINPQPTDAAMAALLSCRRPKILRSAPSKAQADQTRPRPDNHSATEAARASAILRMVSSARRRRRPLIGRMISQ